MVWQISSLRDPNSSLGCPRLEEQSCTQKGKCSFQPSPVAHFTAALGSPNWNVVLSSRTKKGDLLIGNFAKLLENLN